MNLLFGCGYLGSRVARLWREQGKQVVVVTRSATRAAELATSGYTPLVADVTEPESLLALSQIGPIESVFYAVACDPTSGKSRQQVYVDGLQNVLAALPAVERKFIFISTTSVYAQNDGGWVDERSPCEPATEGGQLFLEAERLLRRHRVGQQTIVLRLAGIYGPGRIPRREELLAAETIRANPDTYLNLIHVDDAARTVLAVEEQGHPPCTYLVSDGCPVLRRDYYNKAAQILGAPAPKFGHAATPRHDSRGGTNKRISNTRLKTEIKLELQYPNYKHGLSAPTVGS